MSGDSRDMPYGPRIERGQSGDSSSAGRSEQPSAARSGARLPQAGQGTPQNDAFGQTRKKGRKRRRRRQKARDIGANGAANTASAPAGTGQGAVQPQMPPVDLPASRTPAYPQGQAAGGDPHRPARRRFEQGQQKLYAALDLGTNNCRLLVATPGRAGQFRVVDSFSRIVRLGEGLSQTGRLSETAMARAVEALAVCADKLSSRTIRRQRLIATEACRAAENGAEFLEQVRQRTGLELEIVSRETEARLAVAGCASLVERGTPGIVLFDIGGGSTEIALCDLADRRGARLDTHIADWTSLPVGVVSLAERFGGRDVTPEKFEAMVAYVSGLIAQFPGRAGLGEIAGHVDFHLLGTSGTVTTLGGLHLKLERYDRRRIDGLWIDNAAIDAALQELLGWSFDQRVANVCIGPDRADLVLPGCAILEAIRREWPSEKLRVADRGLREGLLTQLMATDGAWRRNHQRRRPRSGHDANSKGA